MMLSTLVHEIAVYPFLVKWIPTILKRIVIGSLLTLLFNITYLVISVVQAADENKSIFTGIIDTFWIELLHSAHIVLLLYTAILEFVCAQTPHNLKGFVIGYTWCTYSLASILAAVTFSIVVANTNNSSNYGAVIFCSVATGLSLISLILMCLAYWYKQRVRDSDETQTPYTWVEGVYRKYFRKFVDIPGSFLYLANIIINRVKKCNAGRKCEITNV